ncbi:putative hydrolase of the HAD superfamily [Fistulifera solaris]|uniref:Putative hydrolase of the HAD superfamily n=1 Tax=Fistulifera solaris TaxID=1519565 RepID=A0A1Z5JSC7_FISSO|nr:putative hydrolase of the HAD superfamily [Fistulifera solaris]|eukprot:GAX16661.1 putative hydrolase of the HAD superfamily [Fistulifera solaris]
MSPVNLSSKPTKLVAPVSVKGVWKQTRSRFLVELWIFLLLSLPVSAFIGKYAGAPRLFSRLRMTSKSEKALSLGILSFDLDDTLFSTNAVIKDANQAMLEKLRRHGVDVQEEEFLDATRQIRRSLDGPITYTSLRKMTIAQFILMTAAFSKEKCDALVDECFDIWLHERHRAAERHLFPQTLNCLSILKEMYPDVCFAAITNGRGNPLYMPALANFFDFCVSGEDHGVFPERKPAPGIYKASLSKYKDLYPHHDHDSRIWIHVGDCLVNDVGASANVGAYAVWLSGEADAVDPKWSTATTSEQYTRQLKEDDGREKIAVRISCLSELPAAVVDLVEGALQPVPLSLSS